MIAYFEQFVNSLKRPKILLLTANILLVFFLILLSNLKVLPIQGFGDFAFFTALFLIFALYRPGWAFLFFVGTIALENINLAPESIGINIRPYQFIGGLATVAVIIRLIFKRLNFLLPKWNWADGLIVIFTISGFISALGHEMSKLALKQAVIVATFAALYFLVRIFVQNLEDLKKIVPFFLNSSVVVIIYGIWQNVRFMKGLPDFEVMPGRSNATFAEADWLGIYITLFIAVLYSLIYYFSTKNSEAEGAQIFNFQFSIYKFLNLKTLLYIILATSYVLLILTVSRSAWLGALAVSFLFVVFSFWEVGLKNKNWKGFFKQLIFLAIAIIFSFAAVYVFKLTNFQLFNRIQSTGTGLQKITISCWSQKCDANGCIQQEMPPVENIKSIKELEKYGCKHVNLEEIDNEKAAGNVVYEIYREDPNVNIRREIYQKSWAEIKKHPILGIGWGNIGKILGKANGGAGLSANDTQFQAELNSSNIFLEVWLGAGLLGMISFTLFLFFGIINAGKNYLRNKNAEEKSLGLFLLLGFMAIVIPNLFNAGIFMGITWLFFGIISPKNTGK